MNFIIQFPEPSLTPIYRSESQIKNLNSMNGFQNSAWLVYIKAAARIRGNFPAVGELG